MKSRLQYFSRPLNATNHFDMKLLGLSQKFERCVWKKVKNGEIWHTSGFMQYKGGQLHLGNQWAKQETHSTACNLSQFSFHKVTRNCASSPGCVADISKVIPLPFPLSFLVRFLGHFADTQTLYWLYGDTGRKTEVC